MLIDQIKNDMFLSKKSGEKIKSSLLTTLYAEAVRVGKDDGNRLTTDAEVVQVIKKFIKNNEETQNALATQGKHSQELISEADILKAYLPKQLSEMELTGIISSMKDLGKNMGDIMKHLKENYAGQYDGKLASEIAKKA